MALYDQLFPDASALAGPVCLTALPPKDAGVERRYVRLLGHGLAELQRHHTPHSPAWQGYQAVQDALADLAPHLSPEEGEDG